MPDPVSVDSLFRESADLFIVLNMDRRVRTANPAFRKVVRNGRAGQDFLDLVPEAGRSSLATDLARAAGGATVLVDAQHESASGEIRRVEWRFFPVEGGLVAGVGRVRSEDPALVEQLGRAHQ